MMGDVSDALDSAAEVEVAAKGLGSPERLTLAREIVTHAPPALQNVPPQALKQGARAPSTFVAEQSQLGMFVGVPVGFEPAHELERQRASDQTNIDQATPSEEY
jgi:hypothetical protein